MCISKENVYKKCIEINAFIEIQAVNENMHSDKFNKLSYL